MLPNLFEPSPSLGTPNVTQRTALVRSSGPDGALPCPLDRGLPLVRGRRQRRKFSVGRIHDERRSVIELSVDHLGDADCRVWVDVAVDIGQGGQENTIAGAVVGICVFEDSIGPLLELLHFLIRQKRSAFQFLRPLQRGRAVVDPHALQIRLAVRCKRRGPRLRRGRSLRVLAGRPGLTRDRRRRQQQKQQKPQGRKSQGTGDDANNRWLISYILMVRRQERRRAII